MDSLFLKQNKVYLGAIAFILSSYFVISITQYQTVNKALLIMLFTFLSYLLVDSDKIKNTLSLFDRTLIRNDVSIDKLIGIYSTYLTVASFYWLFPEYKGTFYRPFFEAINTLLPLAMLFAVPYVFITDSLAYECDAYQILGSRIRSLNFANFNYFEKQELKTHALGWLVKCFFYPLMFCALCHGIDRYDSLTTISMIPVKLFDLIINSLYFFDVGVVCVSYLATFKLLDTHIKSTDKTLLGWLSALICYQPFWGLIGAQYLSYKTSQSWLDLYSDNIFIFWLYASIIIALTFVYAVSTASFGLRFSNLTYRGLINTGFYKFTKHPAYISKNITWWLISVPFIGTSSFQESIRHCILLLLVNLIYYIRAKTEEAHLSNYYEYRAYSQTIDSCGIFSGFKRVYA